MQMIEVSKLKPHPRNKEFFDDITGERWKDFKQSIIRRGVVESIVVTEDPVTHELIIVSGHQRAKACNEIGILEAPCRIVHYPEKDERLHISREDMILEDLICTNIMQRGVGNVNPMKMAKCIRELERMYGIKNGGGNFTGNQFVKREELGNNFVAPNKTQEDLAKQIGIDQRQLQNYKKLNELIPELQSLVETGALKSTTAYKIWARLPKEEQEEFFNEIGIEKIKQMTQKQTQSELNKIICEKEVLEKSFNELSEKYDKEKNKEPKIVEVDNTDYTQIEKLKKELESSKSEKDRIENRLNLMTEKAELYEKDSLEYEKMKNDIEFLTNKKDDLGRQIESITSISGLVVDIDHLIKEKLAPVKYSRALLEAKDDDIVINNLSEIVQVVRQWCDEMNTYLPNKNNYVEVL
ncbi:TPA: ParB N-terminal domain-containing protein [Clostridium botulinum]|nr:ParB N-terminal domain-containing protein [Clostridium botulinum]HCL4455281.1 ParB N-terminal domain-containing protein [Clostridium botulinum]